MRPDKDDFFVLPPFFTNTLLYLPYWPRGPVFNGTGGILYLFSRIQLSNVFSYNFTTTFTTRDLSIVTLYDTVYFKVNNCFYFNENAVKKSSNFSIYFLKIFSLPVYCL